MSSRRAASARGSGSGHDFLAHSFTDLMASLAVIFILLTVVFIRSASQRSEKTKDEVRNGLAEVLEKNKLPLRQDPNNPLALRVAVDEKVLKFPVNSAAISAEGEQFVDGFMPQLVKQLCTEPVRSRLDAIIIEGHTDRSGENTPDGMRRNIKLSQARSFSVLDRAIQSVRANPELSDCLLKVASATGRGSAVPVMGAGGYSPDLSRRVEILIRVKSTEQELSKLQLGKDAAKTGL